MRRQAAVGGDAQRAAADGGCAAVGVDAAQEQEPGVDLGGCPRACGDAAIGECGAAGHVDGAIGRPRLIPRLAMRVNVAVLASVPPFRFSQLMAAEPGMPRLLSAEMLSVPALMVVRPV